MYSQIKNENYGKAVATYGDYVVASNPPILRWTVASSSIYYTGSVDYFKYNKNTDEHDYVNTIYNYNLFDILLDTENLLDIDTETGLDLLIDNFTTASENGFGTSLDMYGKLLVIGSPYSVQSASFTGSSFSTSSSTVELHDLAKTEFPVKDAD